MSVVSDSQESDEDETKTINVKHGCLSMVHDDMTLPPILPCDPKTHLLKLEQLDVNHQDVAVCSYPKSGSHWLQQMIHMLKRKSTEPMKTLTFFDSFPTELIDDIQSPRVWGTHFRFHQIPLGFQKNKGKVIYLIRNPKDIVVSLYEFITSMKLTQFKGSFAEFFQMFKRGEVYYSSWFEHIKSWMKLKDDLPKSQILYVYYENLIKNCFNEIKEIAQFLDISCTDDFLQAVFKACEFSSMKNMTFHYYPAMCSEVREDGTAVVFRKGEVDDWKNWFTQEQLEEFNTLYERAMGGVRLELDYMCDK